MKFKKCKVIRDGTDPTDMFRIRFEDGTISEDFYNHTRATEHSRKIDEYNRVHRPLEAH